MHTDNQNINTSGHAQGEAVKSAWHKPVIGHIDIKRTMFGIGSTTDSNKSAASTYLK